MPEHANAATNRWTRSQRAIVFLLAFTSIACLLLDLYELCPMRAFALVIFAPALLVIAVMAFSDWRTGDRTLSRAILTGALGGLIAAIAYDVFRLPFVLVERDQFSLVPALPLFKVFPRFGAMLLGEPLEQSSYSWAAHLIGWGYHFSNGVTFGIMYVAFVGDPARRSWWWGVLMAAGLEIGMLITPYPQAFGIRLTATFVMVTLCAHAIFGITLGLSSRRLFRLAAQGCRMAR
jgi:hypothetical protein